MKRLSTIILLAALLICATHIRQRPGVRLARQHRVGGHVLKRVSRLSTLDSDILDGFTCGDEWMDDWVSRKAPRQLSCGLCVMHVGLDEHGGEGKIHVCSVGGDALYMAALRDVSAENLAGKGGDIHMFPSVSRCSCRR